MERYFAVLIGGGLGAMARYAVGSAVMARYSGRFPLGMFLINVTGSFLIGLLMALFVERVQGHPNWRLFLVTGVLGGYTTFSSFEYESYLATKSDSPLFALLYILSSVSVGYIAVWIGALIVSKS